MKDEEAARTEVGAGNPAALSIQELLQKLQRPRQRVLYYTGGIRLLTGAVKGRKHVTPSLLIAGVRVD